MRPLYLAAGLAATLVGAAAAQQPATPPPPAAPPLEIGAVAPDFTMSGATRYGVLRNPIHLSDFKGKTVVLAFFFKARTRG
jgi:cytochrome oxidase Cu insertion factor (SCO1/SenC/PrrC family)